MLPPYHHTALNTVVVWVQSHKQLAAAVRTWGDRLGIVRKSSTRLHDFHDSSVGCVAYTLAVQLSSSTAVTQHA